MFPPSGDSEAINSMCEETPTAVGATDVPGQADPRQPRALQRTEAVTDEPNNYLRQEALGANNNNNSSSTTARKFPTHLHINVTPQLGGEEIGGNPLRECRTPFSTMQSVPSPAVESSTFLSTAHSFGSSCASSPATSSAMHPSHTTMIGSSPFMSAGSPAISPGLSENNSVSFHRPGSSPQPTMLPTFFATAHGGNNLVMITQSPAQALCVPNSASSPTVVPYYLVTQSQSPLEMNGGVTYVPMSPGHQSMGTMMCESFGTVAQSQTTATVHSPLTYIPVSMPMSGTLGGGVASPCTPVTGLFSSDLAVKRSPPSYESYRPTQTKRQCAPTRQRSGTNVHGSLQGVCSYYSYNISAALKQYEQMGDVAENPDEQLLPVFFQMFPCELRSRTIVVLNRVVQATCGPDVAVVVSIESRSETSFVALVHTRNVWLLIHRLRCRVLMDRHGFWHAEDFSQYLRLKEYCEGVRRLPQQTRHLRTDGLPCMPLVVELARGIMVPPPNPPLDPPSFDQLVPITTVERRVRGTTTGGEAEAFDKNQQGHEDVMFSH